jgi:hypothetical protein
MDSIGHFALFLAVGGIGISMLLGPIGQAIARRIAGKAPGTDPKTGLTTGEMTAERIAQLEERLVELEAAYVEAQERLEFTERLLGRAAAEPAKDPAP